jgi:hypothetical protein
MASPNRASNALYHLARAYRLMHDETRQAHAVPDRIVPVWPILATGFLRHA